MASPEIHTPKGSIIINSTTMKAELTWNTDFVPKLHEQYSEAQKWLDNEVLMNCEPYVPLLTGMLVKSGILGTEVGSGWVKWIAVYAKAQYYSARMPGSQTGPLRGPQWFERAKAVYKTNWIAGAKKLAGGGGK